VVTSGRGGGPTEQHHPLALSHRHAAARVHLEVVQDWGEGEETRWISSGCCIIEMKNSYSLLFNPHDDDDDDNNNNNNNNPNGNEHTL